METEQPETTPQSVELMPFQYTEAEVEQKFPIVRQDLKNLAASYSGLTIAGVEDKEGMKSVDKARKELKNKRTLITATAKMVRDGANKFAKAVITLEKELIAEIEPTERILEERFDKIEEERERLRQEEQKKEDDRMQDMLNLLRNVGADMDIYELKAITPERFELVLQEATQAFEKKKAEDEERRIEEEKAEAERQRIANEKAVAERKELDDLRIRQEEASRKLAEETRIQEEATAKLREEQRKFEEEKAKLEAEKEAIVKAKMELRITRLKANGFTWTGIAAIFQAHPSYQHVRMSIEEIREAGDLLFDSMMSTLLKLKTDQEQAYSEFQKAEKERLEQEVVAAKAEAELKAAAEEHERLSQSDDGYRYANLAHQIDVSFLKSNIWGYMQSKKGKEVSYEIQQLLKQAHKLAVENARKDEPAA